MKCVTSCISCLCGSRNSARVTPADPLQIVSANASKNHSRYKQKSDNSESDGRVNPNFTIGDGEDELQSSLSDSQENSAVRALFIEVGKDRLLRVIHIRNGVDNNEEEEDGLGSRKGSTNGGKAVPQNAKDSCSSDDGNLTDNPTSSKSILQSSKGDAEASHGDEEEDEYWFSKWARKPRFRSIFAKNPENRPKLGGESNNNVSPEESNKVTAELELARAAAAAKRRAWAYNNNGNCESTITQQPTVTMADEEEFNSIAIVNTTKQQWSKQGSNSGSESAENQETEKVSSPQVQVEVSVESHVQRSSSPPSSPVEGIANPAFQGDDEEDEYDNCETDKTEQNKHNASSTSSKNFNQSTSTPLASEKRRSPSTQSAASTARVEEEDEISIEAADASPGPDRKSVSPVSKTSTSPPSYASPPGETLNSNPKKPILFFVHSIAGSSDVWHQQFEFFQQLGYEIVAPDLLGHGLSSTPLNSKYYLFESLVQDLILIFDHFCKEEDTKVVLIGHGYGACLAAMLTRVRLKNVALFISIAGGGPTPLVRRTCCQDSWFAWKCKLFHSNRVRGRFDNPELRHVLPATIYENLLAGQVWPDGDSAFYRRITVPTLLTYGMRDKVVTLVEECEMERTIPKSFLELIDSAGHMVMVDEPQKLNKMLCKFIQSWS